MVTNEEEPSRYWEQALPLFAERGVIATLATLAPPAPIHDRLRTLGCNAIPLCRKRRNLAVALWALATLARRCRADVIHGHEIVPSIAGGIARRVNGSSVAIYHRHHASTRRRWGAWMSRLASRLADTTVGVSQSSVDNALVSDRVPRTQVRLSFNGVAPFRAVEPDEVAALRDRLGIGEKGLVIGIVGRLRPEKGHSTLFQAMDLLSDLTDAPLHLVVVGDGPEAGRLRWLAKSYRAFDTAFVGHQEDVALWYAVADVVAVPSRREAFGLVAAEAMACSKPVIATRVEGLEEVVVHESSGLLVDPDDAVALAQALFEVLGSPSLARRLAAAGHHRYQRLFTVEQMVDSWVNLYREMATPVTR